MKDVVDADEFNDQDFIDVFEEAYDDVRTIRGRNLVIYHRAARGESQASIGRLYGITQARVYAILCEIAAARFQFYLIATAP